MAREVAQYGCRGRPISPQWSGLSKRDQWVPVGFSRHVRRRKTLGDARKFFSIPHGNVDVGATPVFSRASRTKGARHSVGGEKGTRDTPGRGVTRSKGSRRESDRVHRSAEFLRRFVASAHQPNIAGREDVEKRGKKEKATATIPGRRSSNRGRGAEQEWQ